jgi:hypothetical protein
MTGRATRYGLLASFEQENLSSKLSSRSRPAYASCAHNPRNQDVRRPTASSYARQLTDLTPIHSRESVCLLDVRSYKVKVFTEENVPLYPILSHTWDTEEVTLQDIENGRADKILGFRKIAGCCNQAEIDTF